MSYASVLIVTMLHYLNVQCFPSLCHHCLLTSSLTNYKLKKFHQPSFFLELNISHRRREKRVMGAKKTTPKLPQEKPHFTLKNLFDLDSDHSSITTTIKKSSFFEPTTEEILFVISHCTSIYTFKDPSETSTGQDLKRLKLIQLLSIIKTSKTPIETQILNPLFSMLSANLFRPLPPCNTSYFCTLPDDIVEDLFAVPSPLWPHLQIVYDILLLLIASHEAKSLKANINPSFLLNLLDLFESGDPRERELVKNTYHRIYSKFTFYRSFMRKAMNDVLLHYIFENDHKHCGIGDLLEIWGTIINGFAVPLKEEHKVVLVRVLIPLHKPKGMQVYYRQLGYCVSQFVQKQPDLSEVVLRGILKYWPVTNSQKEVLFIGELEELVDNIEPEDFRSFALPLCTQITKCLNSWNSQVAERALYVWNNERFVNMVSQTKEDVFPVIVKGIEKNFKLHWSSNIKQLTENVKEMLNEMESGLYAQCQRRLQLQESTANHEREKREDRWGKVEAAATRNEDH